MPIFFFVSLFQSNNSNTKIIKKGAYVSKSLARSFRLEPLSKEEHYKANMDIALYPPQGCYEFIKVEIWKEKNEEVVALIKFRYVLWDGHKI